MTKNYQKQPKTTKNDKNLTNLSDENMSRKDATKNIYIDYVSQKAPKNDQKLPKTTKNDKNLPSLPNIYIDCVSQKGPKNDQKLMSRNLQRKIFT